MDARELLLAEHALIHSDSVAVPEGNWPGTRPIPSVVWTRLSDSQIREQLPGHNSIAWLLWHMARSEDAGINAFLRGVPEVLDGDGWLERMGVDLRHLGTGMSAAEASEFSARVDIGALRAYRDAVGRETRSWLESADLACLDREVDGVSDRVISSGALLDGPAGPIARGFNGRTGAYIVMRLAIWHNFFHLGHVEHTITSLGVSLRSQEASAI